VVVDASETIATVPAVTGAQVASIGVGTIRIVIARISSRFTLVNILTRKAISRVTIFTSTGVISNCVDAVGIGIAAVSAVVAFVVI